MYIMYGKPQSIADIKDHSLVFNANIRNQIPIAIIDDQVFAYESLLKEHSYNIKHFDDVSDIRSVEAYPIILCDIKGVGKVFKSKYEGGHLIREIRSFYPYKVIYAYSAHQLDPSYNKYFQSADKTLKKDIDLEEWITYLDEALKMVIDPAFLWKRLRLTLLDEGVAISEVMKLEDQFVSYIREKKPQFPDKKYSTNLSDNAKSILLGFGETLKIVSKIKGIV